MPTDRSPLSVHRSGIPWTSVQINPAGFVYVIPRIACTLMASWSQTLSPPPYAPGARPVYAHCAVTDIFDDEHVVVVNFLATSRIPPNVIVSVLSMNHPTSNNCQGAKNTQYKYKAKAYSFH